MKKITLITITLLMVVLALNSAMVRGMMSWFNTPATTRAEIIGKDGAMTVTGANTIVNKYAVLGADAQAGSSVITIIDPGGAHGLNPSSLSAGDLLLIIQIAGSSIDTSDSPSYGAVINLNNAGRYEFVTVNEVTGNNIRVNPPCSGLKFSYTASGKVQIIRVPQYTSLTINNGASLTSAPWDGQIGGIVAVHVQTNAIINGTVDVSGSGLRGGALASAGGGGFRTDYRTIQQDFGAEKGEGIAGSQLDYDLIGGRYGRGAPANAGGGGTAHNSAGGGGANGNNGNPYTGNGVMDPNPAYPAAWALDPGYISNANALTNSSGGGRGGYSYAVNEANAMVIGPGNAAWAGDHRRDVGGRGGHPLAQDTSGRIFLGGGGGAGTQNNNSGGAGGNAGGLIYIIADNVSGNGVLRANGSKGGDTRNDHRDGAGGGGAGGTIVVSAKTLSGINAVADGGDGGNQSTPTQTQFPNESEGPGGAGGGGFIAYSSGGIATSVRGGLNGTTQATSLTEFPPNGATRGAAGNTTTTVDPIPFCRTTTDLSITKTNNTNTIIPGAPTTYAITATNNGPNPVFGISITDNLPAVFSNISWTCTASSGSRCHDPAGAGNINTKVDLQNGGSVTFLLTATPNPAAVGSVTNTARVEIPAGAVDINPTNNSASDTDTFTPQADLSISKTNGVNAVTAGLATAYNIVVRNDGPSTVIGATVSDALPAQLTNASWTCVASAGSSCGLPGGSGGINTTVSLIPNGTATFTLTATVLASATGTLSNTAVVTPPTGLVDTNTGNNTVTDIDAISLTADLVITKTNGSGVVTPGAQTSYRIVVANNGPSVVTGAVVTDNPPNSLTNVTWTCTASAGSSCGAASGQGNINTTVDLALNGTATFTMVAIVSSGATGTITNTASVTAPGGTLDPNINNNSSSATTTAQPSSDVRITKTPSQTLIRAGEELTYTLNVANLGPSVASDVIVSDTLHSSLVLVSATASQGSCAGTATVRCNLNTLGASAPNNIASVAIRVRVPLTFPPGQLPNTGLVETTTPDPVMGNNTSVTTVTVNPAPRAVFRVSDMNIRNTTSDVCIGGATIVNIEVKLTNSGDGMQRDNPGPEFLAQLPLQLSAIAGSCNASTGNCTASPRQVQWNGEVAPGQTITINYRVQVKVDTQPGARLCTDYEVNYDTNGDGENDSTTTLNNCIVANCTPPPCSGPDCPNNTPGDPFPDGPNAISSDQRPGSILIYPYYTSDATSATQHNTRISITNTEPFRPAYLHLFFVDGATCTVADNFICLTPSQTISFLVSDMDPGVAGYLIVIAVDKNGCPTKFNHLIGESSLKQPPGYIANLGAVAVPAIEVSACDLSQAFTTINLNGIQYSRLGRVLAIDNLPSVANGNSTLLVLNSIGGNLGDSSSNLGPIFGLLFDDKENPYSFTLNPRVCQLRETFSSSFPRSSPRLSEVIPAGQSGWIKLGLQNEGAMVGVMINANPNASGYRGGHNLHLLTLGNTSLTIPIFAPPCQ